jgi:hypothetical protein
VYFRLQLCFQVPFLRGQVSPPFFRLRLDAVNSRIQADDIFSYLPTKNLWIDHEWGSGVIFFVLVNILDEWGIFVLKAFIIFLIFMLISAPWQKV